MANPDDSEALAAAFRNARYHVPELGVAGEVRVGTQPAALEAALGAEAFGFITAWDSSSKAEPRMDNDAADGALTAELERLGADHLRAYAEDAQGAHREQGWLVTDVPLPDLDRLARRFGQDGTLAWSRGEAVRLRMYRPRPADPAAELWTDWVE
ncbi:MAG: hypothetical protein JWL98_1183 [Xanthomonadaceae bacterium]|nr:hypothetical protein [Xanthomonadaceae bacterium]